jgi:hypothetical protein
MDKGTELNKIYCPTGYRVLTNMEYKDNEQNTLWFIEQARKFYGGVAVGPAFMSNGYEDHNMIAIYVKIVESTIIFLGTLCPQCKKAYEDKDMIKVETYYRKEETLCLNCFNFYSYDEINGVMVNRYKYG